MVSQNLAAAQCLIVVCSKSYGLLFVCSAGLLSIIPDQGLRAQIENPASKQALGKLADKFVDDIRQGRHNKEGWPNSMYGKQRHRC